MHRVLRAFLTCLLLAAVPLQGYAATGMLFCGTWNAGAGADAVHAAGDEAHHVPHQAAAPTHAEPHDGAGEHATAVDADPSGAFDLHHVAHGKCSACASCCSAAALPTAAISATFHAPTATPAAEHMHADPDRGPVRLERPPRLILA